MKSKLLRLGVGIGLSLTIISILVVHRGLARPSVANPIDHPEQETPFDQEKALVDLRKAIAGNENKPASEVFKNIQILKNLPAGRLLRVMELGYARSLGVNCTHCHVAGEWEKEDKPTKQVTREMMGMVNSINSDLLKKIKNLKSATPTVNCTTCHRGQTKPELNMPEAARP